MATTTNYGWTTPDDTALVKDGASAIRSLGSSIDSTLKTQIDAQIPDSIIDAKGDLIVGTADNTPARLASSAVNNDVLMVDTSTASGLKWAAPSAGGLTSIATGTLSSTAVTISSIPSTYVDLYLVIDSPTGSATENIAFRYNGVTTAAYQQVGFRSSSSAILNDTSQTQHFTSQISLQTTNSQYQSFGLIVRHYSKATYHNVQFFGNNDGQSIFFNGFIPTAAAINSLTIKTASTATFSGGTYTLYGVK